MELFGGLPCEGDAEVIETCNEQECGNKNNIINNHDN